MSEKINKNVKKCHNICQKKNHKTCPKIGGKICQKNCQERVPGICQKKRRKDMSPKCQNNVTRNLKMSQYMSRHTSKKLGKITKMCKENVRRKCGLQECFLFIDCTTGIWNRQCLCFRRFSENNKSDGDGGVYTSGLGFLKVIDFFRAGNCRTPWWWMDL